MLTAMREKANIRKKYTLFHPIPKICAERIRNIVAAPRTINGDRFIQNSILRNKSKCLISFFLAKSAPKMLNTGIKKGATIPKGVSLISPKCSQPTKIRQHEIMGQKTEEIVCDVTESSWGMINYIYIFLLKSQSYICCKKMGNIKFDPSRKAV